MGVEGHDRPCAERGHEGEHRRHQEEPPVRAGGDDDLLQEQLDDVRERLEEAARPDPVRPETDLDVADDLALGEREVGDREHERDHDREDLEDGEDRDLERVGQPGDRAGDELGHHESTGSTVTGPHAGPRPTLCATPAWRRRHPSATVGSSSTGEGPLAPVLPHGGHPARDEAERTRDGGVDPDRGGRRLDGALERPGAPDEGVDRVERHVAHPPERGGGSGVRPLLPFARGRAGFDIGASFRTGEVVGRNDLPDPRVRLRPHVLDAFVVEAFDAEPVPEHAQDPPRRARLPGRGGRRLVALAPPFRVVERARGLGE